MKKITRLHTNARMSQVVTHGDVVYLAGQVGQSGDSVKAQTRTALERLETLLMEAGSSPQHMLQATIWLADMADFNEMNEVWDAWVPKECAPTRACGEAKLADPGLLVEVIVVAAVAS